MQGGRVNGVHLSGGRFRVGKEMAKVGITSLRANLGPLHIVRIVRSLDEEIFRDRFTECGQADLAVEFVERCEEWFAGNDIDVDAGAVIIPELILERRFRAALPHDVIFLGFQSPLQDGVAGDRPVRIETCGLAFLFLREKEEVERPGDEHDRDADTDVRADHRFFFAGDSAPVHLIAMNAIESEIGYVRQDVPKGSGERQINTDFHRFSESAPERRL
jgi:hypothetical protein